jgi:hypothetical protein
MVTKATSCASRFNLIIASVLLLLVDIARKGWRLRAATCVVDNGFFFDFSATCDAAKHDLEEFRGT